MVMEYHPGVYLHPKRVPGVGIKGDSPTRVDRRGVVVASLPQPR